MWDLFSVLLVGREDRVSCFNRRLVFVKEMYYMYIMLIILSNSLINLV